MKTIEVKLLIKINDQGETKGVALVTEVENPAFNIIEALSGQTHSLIAGLNFLLDREQLWDPKLRAQRAMKVEFSELSSTEPEDLNKLNIS